MPPIVNQSNDPANDALTGPGHCGTAAPGRLPGPLRLRPAPAAARRLAVGAAQLRRQQLTDQTSILRFIEDNWGLGRIGNQSFDAKAGSLDGMFNFGGHPHTQQADPEPDHRRGRPPPRLTKGSPEGDGPGLRCEGAPGLLPLRTRRPAP